MTFLILQFVLDFNYAWIVWPSLIFTLSIPRMILNYSDSDEEVYEELKEADAKERKKRLKKAAARIQELERRNSRTDE
ncbi:putative membrane protein [Hoyosella altamirensis]|uniref:Putative membrane protein n=1 Tax=Hoyosella altamirensis TaxID=616997 RepID=A0A839RI71_9ACTN|nr:putative membrane protein [Hoyosella altamirensis]